MIFGGWDDDFLHGGSGDDAISGAEALPDSYVQMYDFACTSTQQTDNCVVGLVRTDFAHPWNPGDILRFGDDTNPWLHNGRIAPRMGEFLLYDEYDPRRAILFNADGTVWKSGAFSSSLQAVLPQLERRRGPRDRARLRRRLRRTATARRRSRRG